MRNYIYSFFNEETRLIESSLRILLGAVVGFLLLLCTSFIALSQTVNTKKERSVSYYKLSFENRTGDLTDTLFYNPQRLLVWSDFKAAPRATSSYSAAAFTGFGYTGKIRYSNDTAIIAIRLEVYFIKPFSWVHENSKNNYALAHEQRHFDITYLITERFKQRLLETDLDADYDSIIQYQYIQAYREMNRLQEKYDNETRHGLIESEQERWERQVKAWLDGIKD
ncbi:hypothetical protein NF867_17895 [Solitalea sp. MAHUQ-68]|uniref:DUF922 domain-containing protein n=1 Tax=Solitalea agri TaxID=2953739 RepID=A0A9X2F5X3_9SPHI|nr:hypothetical protein [Solitalea agri]MCO4294740.1 hypothetical protein [Solitalea agri]